MTTVYDIHLNKKVFLVTNTSFFYNGVITDIDNIERKLTINDRKLGSVTLDFRIIDRIEPRGDNFG